MKNIVILGSINMDLVTIVDRKPLDGETIIGKEFFQVGGGKGANQGISIGKLGGKGQFLGLVGNDAYGEELLDNMKKAGLDISRVGKKETSTGLASITLDSKGENSIIVIQGANALVDKDYINENQDIIKNADILLCQLEIPLESVEYAFKIAKENKVKTILNPAPAMKSIDSLLSLTNILVLNESEFNILCGQDIENISQLKIREEAEYFFKLGIEELIITLGSKGVLHLNKNIMNKYEAYKVEAIDTTGAGDSFIGAFSTFLYEGIEKAIHMGMKAGAIAVTRLGAQSSLANLEEVENFGK